MKKVYGTNISLGKIQMFKNKVRIIFILVVVVVAALAAYGLFSRKSSNNEFDGPTYQVKRGPLTISFVESGTIKARDQIIIKNEVEGRTSIISLVPEGTRVKKGDLLVELDASSLEDAKIDQEIRVQNADASYISSYENLAVVKNKAESDVILAKLNLEFAKQDLEKYIEGEYPYELDKAEAQIQLAEEELTRANDTLDWSRRLHEEKYISKTELRADEIAAKKRNLDVELAKKSKELLTSYTHSRNLAQLKSDVEQAGMALERTERKARADVIQADAELKAKEAEFNRQKDKLEKIEDQIVKTRVYAPADGLAIYATSAKTGGWRRNVEPLDEGQEVREREELIYLPTGSASKAEITIHESNLKKTRVGLPAVVTIDTLPGETFYGTVKQIAPLPDAQSMWMNPDLKVYNSEIYIDGNSEFLRTGTSCQAEIIVRQYPDAVYVPLQAVMRVGSQPTVYVQAGDAFQARNIKTGLDNNKMIHVLEGLEAGEIVLLSPPLKEAAVDAHNADSVLGEVAAESLRQKISGSLGNAPTEQPQTTPVWSSDDEPAGQQGQRRRFENLDPEKMELMRKQFEEMSAQEREKMRQKSRKSRRQSNKTRAAEQEKQ